MGIDRREFLKIAGLTTFAGFGGLTAGDALARGPQAHGKKGAGQGTRWAMVVDLKRLRRENLDGLIGACHRLHNVPDIKDKEEEVWWIAGESFEHTFPSQQHAYVDDGLKRIRIPVLCNHCDNPPCVRVCPTKATFRRDDGIVTMDYHRCIGCRFCMAGCPYGSRSFNWRDPRPRIKEINPDFPTRTKGVVEKCTFCVHLIDKGGKPACVDACKYGGLLFGDLNDPNGEVRRALQQRYSLRRKPELGTNPEVFYLL